MFVRKATTISSSEHSTNYHLDLPQYLVHGIRNPSLGVVHITLTKELKELANHGGAFPPINTFHLLTLSNYINKAYL